MIDVCRVVDKFGVPFVALGLEASRSLSLTVFDSYGTRDQVRRAECVQHYRIANVRPG